MSNSDAFRLIFYRPLEEAIQSLITDFSAIPAERKAILKQLTHFLEARAMQKKKTELVFICTHNSRRSHIAQIWAQAAAAYYGIENVQSYSGGTEATSFNSRAVKAMRDVGFGIIQTSEGVNPAYHVRFTDEEPGFTVFSKTYDHKSNPEKGYAAVMTCSHADENCPVVSGMEKRISLPYNDPKDFDDSPDESRKYAERVREIGTEILFAFSEVKS